MKDHAVGIMKLTPRCFQGACSCGWRGKLVGSRSTAKKHAIKHMDDALSGKRE